MKSVLVFDYMATGEGRKIKIKFSNSLTDEKAMEKFKSSMDPYYHVSIEAIPLEAIVFNKLWIGIIKEHVPVLHDYILNNWECAIGIDYESYQNYS